MVGGCPANVNLYVRPWSSDTPRGARFFAMDRLIFLNAPPPLEAFSVLSTRYLGSGGRKSVSEMCFVGRASDGLMGPSASNQSVYLGNFQGQFTSILSPAGFQITKFLLGASIMNKRLSLPVALLLLLAVLSLFIPQ